MKRKRNKKLFKDYERVKKGNPSFGRMRPSVQLSRRDKESKRNILKAKLRKQLGDDC